MPIFATEYPALQITTVTDDATAIYNTYTYTSPEGTTYTFPEAGVTLRDITLINTGSVACYIQSASGTTGGVELEPGQQMTIRGWNALTASESTDVLYAYTSSGTTTVEVGLASVLSVA